MSATKREWVFLSATYVTEISQMWPTNNVSTVLTISTAIIWCVAIINRTGVTTNRHVFHSKGCHINLFNRNYRQSLFFGMMVHLLVVLERIANCDRCSQNDENGQHRQNPRGFNVGLRFNQPREPEWRFLEW